MPACPTCERRFDTERGLRVHHSHVHDERLLNRTCARCGREFYAPHEKKYCSPECRTSAVSFAGAANPNYRGGKTSTTCDLCGESFEYYPSAKEGHYCSSCVETRTWQEGQDLRGSENPRWNGGKLELECAVCAEPIERYPSNVGNVAVCGERCRRRWLSDAFTGEGHPNWKGGDPGPYGKGWNAVRRAALERDGYECVRCGASKDELGRNPDVHHIVPVRAFVESDDHEKTDAHSLENVASLCLPCHRKADFGKLSAETLRALVDASSRTDGPTTAAAVRRPDDPRRPAEPPPTEPS